MAKNNKGLAVVLGLVGLGGLAALASRGKKTVKIVSPVPPEENKHGAPLQLTPNFNLSEFLQSETFPIVKNYKLTDLELANVSRLANVLQRARTNVGPIFVNSGGRPKSLRDSKGRSFDDALKEAGASPSATSDHPYFAAADITTGDDLRNKQLWELLQADKDVRQTIYYEPHEGHKSHVHVAVKHPNAPNDAKYRAFVKRGGHGTA